ncbi:hypothetical protein H4K35_11520 [Myroides sp. NP-2]|uniref:hypothetical protein n=1 Tax=Myroides sp. NP-2 TaxID=2759945 RepID=UPI0015F7A081|nr:hypothetical protein [Myroides sp. NP-2]MBB1150735.1 hypothetical protein [Myroides sp. NP-2]
MKKLMLMGAVLLSVGSFAQSGVQTAETKSFFAEYEKEGYIQVDESTAYNRAYDCWIGLLFECNENGEPEGDFLIPLITAYSQAGLKAKQREYCETGTVKVLRDCEPSR